MTMAVQNQKPFPWYRVVFRSQGRSSYCDNSRSKSFRTETDAIEFASGLRGAFRHVEKITGVVSAGYGYEKWVSKTIAKWGIKTINKKRVIGRIK
jgi:hypothetical protein